MELREQFEKLHPMPEGVSWSDGLGMYACEFLAYQNAEKRQNALWQGFQAGHAAGLEQQAKRIAELESKLVAAQSLHDKTVTLYDYLLETDEEGLIHHATQMRDVCLAVHEYRSAGPSFDKEPK